MNPAGKYAPFKTVVLLDRQWPSRETTQAPIWCSVDLRDGNQALAVPMTVPQKMEMFDALVRCGFKEIEVGFPASSQTEFEFVRRLIEEKRIPDDVTIQVLVQCREDLIIRTVDSLVGAKQVIIHLYNSTSPAQRRIVFGLDKSAIIALAVEGTRLVQRHAAEKLTGTDVRFEYSPESFSTTEVEFALEVCEAVMDIWSPTPECKMILNLPGTVEASTPNRYADMIEWFCTNMTRRDCVYIGVHTHNDRGTGVAATEMGMLAGADRVDGTLFGNGERTGNVDIITIALNLYTQGIDPGLDFSNLDELRAVYEKCTGMKVPERHPYSGQLVFTAFSGSHQDAIRKGFRARSEKKSQGDAGVWEVPYLTIDPQDLGRKYNEVVRVNGQSGKGGIAYFLEQGCGIHLPKDMIREFGLVAGKAIDALGREVTPEEVKAMLWAEYVEKTSPYKLESFNTIAGETGCRIHAELGYGDTRFSFSGDGNGPIDAFVRAFNLDRMLSIRVLDQAEHALGQGSEASAIAYVQVQFQSGEIRWGSGIHTSVPIASIRAIVSALNRE